MKKQKQKIIKKTVRNDNKKEPGKLRYFLYNFLSGNAKIFFYKKEMKDVVRNDVWKNG